MREFMPFIVIGLTTGAVYALTSLGLVLTYVTSGVFNFAHGAVGMVAAYLFYDLRTNHGVPTPVALVLTLFVFAPLMGITIDRVFLRRLEGTTAATYVVASIGLLVGLQALISAIYGPQYRRVDTFLPTGSYRLFDVNVGYDQTIIVALALVVGIGLVIFFGKTHLGLATRAVVSDRALTGLVGTNAVGVTTFSWALGSVLAALAGILFAPMVGLDSLLLTLVVVNAFAAAVIGRLKSFPLTMVGAFGLAVAQSLAVKIVSEHNLRSLQQLPTALPFLMLFGVFVFARKGTFKEATTVRLRTRRASVVRTRFPAAPLVVTAVTAVLVAPFLDRSQILTASSTVAFALVFSSLGLLIGLSRQVSLAHAVFVALGATSASHLLSAGVPFPLAILLGAAVLIPVGGLLAIPALRLSGLFLAVATLGFGILVQNVVFPLGFAFGLDNAAELKRPGWLSGDLAFYYFALAIVIAGIVCIECVRVTRLGRVLRALADSPTAVRSLGINEMTARTLVFCLSAFFAGVGGGLLGSLIGSVNTDSFHFLQSLVWVAVLVTAGAASFGGSILATLLLITVPGVIHSPTLVEWQPVVFGVVAIMMAQADNGLVGLVRKPDLSALAEASRWRLASRRSVENYRRAAATGGRKRDNILTGAEG